MEQGTNAQSMFSKMPQTGEVRSRLHAAVLAAHARFAQGLPLLGDGPSQAPGGVRDSDMTHAWLFTGPPGSGRSITAKAFAAALLCHNHANPGCGHCEGCTTAWAETHGDLKIIRTAATIIPVDVVREEIRPWAARMPTTADCRVLIVEDADRFNENSANAMLKLVEEPPLRTVIIMCAPTANAADFSVTLRSRSRHIYVPTPHAQEVAAILQAGNPELTEEQARWAATVAAGHIGRARGFATDEGSRVWRAKSLDYVEAVFDPARAYLVARQLANEVKDEVKRRLEPVEAEEIAKLENSLGMGAKGKGAASALRGSKGILNDLEQDHKRRRKRAAADLFDLSLTDIMHLYRDALVLASGAVATDNDGDGVGLIHPDRQRVAQELARRLGPEAILASLDALMRVRDSLATAVSIAVLFDELTASLQLAGRVGVR